MSNIIVDEGDSLDFFKGGIAMDDYGLIDVDHEDVDYKGSDDEDLSDDSAEKIDISDIMTRISQLMVENAVEDLKDDGSDECISVEDYHNRGVELSRKGNTNNAIEVCEEGLRHFPNDVDLIADIMKYNAEKGDYEHASFYYEIMKTRISIERWNWRAFTFALDYLIGEDPVKNEQECRKLISNYKKYIPYEEKAFMAESELEEALGNDERCTEVLEEALNEHVNACQCSLKLADRQLERGMYEDSIRTSNYGMAASAMIQPTINIAYLYLVRALAKDALLHRKQYRGETIEKAEVEELSQEYLNIASEFMELRGRVGLIMKRNSMLKFLKTVE